jgi:hypothetical protein
MIATNIDGSAANSSSQLLDLLTLVANPDAYTQKVKDLEDLIAKNQAVLDLVGPASDILTLREEVRAEKVAAKQAVAEAKKKAAGIIADAEASAAEVAAVARTVADGLLIETEALNIAAKANAAATFTAEKSAKAAATESRNLSAKLKDQIADAASEKERASAAVADAEQVKQDILAKHKAFIESLA